MNVSLCFFLWIFFTQDEHELRWFDYMKDVVLDEGIPTQFISYFRSYILFYMNFQKS
jgi:hypothetical protein